MTDLLNLNVNGDRPPRGRGVSGSGVWQEVLIDVVAVGLEQDTGDAQLHDLLLGPLDHEVALACKGGHNLARTGHFKALFGARLGLQLGHLALLNAAFRAPRWLAVTAEFSLER